MEKKEETLIYKGLGFPVELINVPMKKVLGEWVIDIDMNELQLCVFNNLVHQPTPLNGKQLRFMRKFLGMSTTEFGQKLGVTHAAIVKWENEQSKISPTQEAYIRLFLFNCLQDKDMMSLYKEITPQKLAAAKHTKASPPSIHMQAIRTTKMLLGSSLFIERMSSGL